MDPNFTYIKGKDMAFINTGGMRN